MFNVPKLALMCHFHWEDHTKNLVNFRKKFPKKPSKSPQISNNHESQKSLWNLGNVKQNLKTFRNKKAHIFPLKNVTNRSKCFQKSFWEWEKQLEPNDILDKSWKVLQNLRKNPKFLEESVRLSKIPKSCTPSLEWFAWKNKSEAISKQHLVVLPIPN